MTAQYTADQRCRVMLTHVRTEHNFFKVRTLRVNHFGNYVNTVSPVDFFIRKPNLSAEPTSIITFQSHLHTNSKS